MTNKFLAVRVAYLAAAFFCATNIAFAQADAGKDALYVKSLASTCANCHGTHGKAVDGSVVVSIAGLDPAYLVAQMNAFKAGTRPATIMHQISKGYSDAQIQTLAAYFAAQKK